MRVVVIGGGAAGATAASKSKRASPGSEVVLVERTNMISHAPCGIPYAIGGIADPDRLYEYTPERFESERGVKVLTNTEVIDIDIDKKAVTLSKDGKTDEMRYDKLIIATGAKPIVPKIDGWDLEEVAVIRHPAHIREYISKVEKSKRIAVVGGGYLGVELAENLIRLGKRVLLIERLPYVLFNSIDSEFADIVTNEMRSRGVELYLGESVSEIRRVNGSTVIVTDKSEITSDMVILAIGVIPDSSLAERAGISLGVKKAIRVNEYMETSAEDVFAAGDVAEKTHKILKEKVWIPLATTANKEGFVAGTNAIFSRKVAFPGVTGTSITRFGELYIAKTGLNERESREKGIDVEAKTIRTRTKPHYYPGGSDLRIKLIVRRSDETIVGAQVLGYTEMVAGYIDSLAIAIEQNMTLERLFFSDLSYMPATSTVWHPLIRAARVLMRRGE